MHAMLILLYLKVISILRQILECHFALLRKLIGVITCMMMILPKVTGSHSSKGEKE